MRNQINKRTDERASEPNCLKMLDVKINNVKNATVSITKKQFTSIPSWSPISTIQQRKAPATFESCDGDTSAATAGSGHTGIRLIAFKTTFCKTNILIYKNKKMITFRKIF